MTSFAFRSLRGWATDRAFLAHRGGPGSRRGRARPTGYGAAIRLLESEKDRGFSNINEAFLLIYLYCHNGRVEDAETLAKAQAGSIPKDGLWIGFGENCRLNSGFALPLEK